MRKLMLLAVVALVALPSMGWAQVPSCPTCWIGLFDDVNLNKNFGDVTPSVPKDIYLGVHLDPTAETGVTGLEFSIYGMRQVEDGILVLSVDALTPDPPAVALGTIPAPADTSSTTTGTGGYNVAWATCQEPGALLKIQILTFAPLSNKVFKVLKRFPPTNPLFSSSIFTRCNPPEFTVVQLPGGCYIAGWDGVTDPVQLCSPHVPVTTSSWSGMKQLYR